jgi:hypothetical protein
MHATGHSRRRAAQPLKRRCSRRKASGDRTAPAPAARYGAKGPTADRVAHTLSELQAALRHATLAMCPGLDHFAPEKKPQQTATAVAAFFEAKASPTGPAPRDQIGRAGRDALTGADDRG